MSYTMLQAVLHNDRFIVIEKYENSHLFAMYIWASMGERYLGFEYVPVGDKPRMQQIWDLSKREDIPLDERITLMTTFDYAMVKQADLRRVIDAYLTFEGTYDGSSHLRDMRADIESLRGDPTIKAICWTATSITGDMWKVYEPPPIDKERDYDMTHDNKHWFLFDEGEADHA